MEFLEGFLECYLGPEISSACWLALNFNQDVLPLDIAPGWLKNPILLTCNMEIKVVITFFDSLNRKENIQTLLALEEEKNPFLWSIVIGMLTWAKKSLHLTPNVQGLFCTSASQRQFPTSLMILAPYHYICIVSKCLFRWKIFSYETGLFSSQCM